MAMVLLTSLGAFGDVGLKDGSLSSETIKMLRLWMTWIFGFVFGRRTFQVSGRPSLEGVPQRLAKQGCRPLLLLP